MYKIRKIKFKDHPILKNLELDFCGQDGTPVDTVIIAGENGTGKSALLNELYKIASHSVNRETIVEITNGSRTSTLTYRWKHFPNRTPNYIMYVTDGQGMDTYSTSDIIKYRYPFNGIFSDVDINFVAKSISTVTSLTLDSEKKSRRSTSDLPTTIKQLLIDVQALDDADVAQAVRANPNAGLSELLINERIPRFTKAFNRMFDDLSYSHVESINGHKAILFEKCGRNVDIDGLSSGEKQVVYRGCFLLRDVNATNGAFVFLDEPEISLHPSWQKKIMDYYKGIFTNENGEQTSQIFAVTHSPFIIHNDNRKNDKVIVLARDKNGEIVVKDKPEYYICNSTEAIQDAFFICGFSANQPTVYLEGQTDEKYFNRAVEVFERDVPFIFKWVGYIDSNGQEVNTGDKSIDKAFHFLVAQNTDDINICLKDCDTNRQLKRVKNVIATSVPKYENAKGIEKGIENALILDDIDMSPYYISKEKIGNYGEKTQYQEFDKMACCESICSMDDDTLKKVFANLKETIEHLINLYNN